MNSETIFNFINKNKFRKLIGKLNTDYENIIKDFDFFSNKIDPFSALTQMFFEDRDIDNWVSVERVRQIQKSLQNSIGYFHQGLICNLNDWSPMNEIGDAINKSKKIIVEVKNKYNTEKGEKKAKVYDNLASLLKKKDYQNYTAYYLYIIRNSKNSVNKPFTPSDNTKKKKKKRKSREDLREIDGVTFFTLITEDKLFLKKVYYEMFNYLKELTGKSELAEKILTDKRFEEFFDKTFN